MATEAVQPESTVPAQAGRELVRRLQQADQAAYADLCGLFGAALHRYAASRLWGDQDLAEEVAVETLTEAVRNIRRFDPRKASLPAWLYGIARRHLQAEWRRQRRKRSVPAEAQIPIDELAHMAEDPGLEATAGARIEAQRQVARLSLVLSDTEMELLMLSYVEEFSAGEIGRLVGRSERAVESLLHRAKQKARACLGDDDG
jgi:RNA polymerase sigma-70 factor (ECF subfamily)